MIEKLDEESSFEDGLATKRMGGGRWKLQLFYVVLVATAFWFIDHDVESSEYFKYRMDYEGSINKTADRVENINRYSTLARASLGVFCVAIMFVVPPKQNLRWAGFLLFSMAAYFCYCGASVIWSIDPRLTVLKMGSFTFFVLAAIGLARRLDLNELAIVFSSVCLIYIIAGLVAEVLSGNFKPTDSEYRFVGTCHPNILGGYAAVCCLGAGVYSKNRRRISLMTILFFATGIVTLLLCKSRTSLFGVVFALFAIRGITLRPGTRFIAILLLALGLAMGLSYFAISGGRGRSNAGNVAAMGRTENTSTLTGRIPLWEELVESIEERPMMGHGYLAFWSKDQVERLASIFNWEIPHGHNMYIDVLLDGGAIGLFLFLAVFVVGLVFSFRHYFKHREIGSAFVFGLILFVLIHGVGESLFKLHTFLSIILVTSLIRLGSLDESETN